MTAHPGVKACIEFGRLNSQMVQQEATSSDSIENDTIANQHNEQHQMATTSVVDAQPWTSFHGIPSTQTFEGGYAGVMSNDHPGLNWPSSPDTSSMALQEQNNYHLETSCAEQQFDHGAHASSMVGWHGTYAPTPLTNQQIYFSSDQSRPRTFRPMDYSQFNIISFDESTIAPQQLHHHDTPGSDPYQYGDEYSMHAIAETVEDRSSIVHQHQQQMSGYNDWFPDPHSASYRSTPMDDDIDFDEHESDSEKHEPYAKTLYRCLREAPNHTMVLRDIYEWFKANTLRGKEPHEKGWQNSIRHNLSMNQAFEKIENTANIEPSRRGYQWRLTDQALREGRVQSTTRFRNKMPNKRGARSHYPSAQRQMSGSKGGQVARDMARHRRSQRARDTQRRRFNHSYHNLRSSRGMASNDVTIVGHVSAATHVPMTPSAAAIRVDGFNDPASGASSPYPSYEPVYEWPTQNVQAPLANTGPMPGLVQQDQYMVTSNPHTPSTRDTPEIIWREPGDTVFCDSSDATSTTPATPASFGDVEMPPDVFGLGMNECPI